jgi:hypothetical protein
MTEPHDDTPATAVVPGVLLWLVVLGGLTYGVVETVQKASSLFGG